MNEKNARLLAIFNATNTKVPDVDIGCHVKTSICVDGLKLYFTPKGSPDPSITLTYDPYVNFWKVFDFDNMLPNYTHALLRVKYLFKNLAEREEMFAGSGQVFDGILDYLVAPCCPKENPDDQSDSAKFGTPEKAS